MIHIWCCIRYINWSVIHQHICFKVSPYKNVCCILWTAMLTATASIQLFFFFVQGRRTSDVVNSCQLQLGGIRTLLCVQFLSCFLSARILTHQCTMNLKYRGRPCLDCCRAKQNLQEFPKLAKRFYFLFFGCFRDFVKVFFVPDLQLVSHPN